MHAFLSLVALAVAASSVTVQAATPTCNLVSLVPLLVDTRNDECFASSGVIFPPTKAPTAALWKRTCNVKACSSLYADLLTATPSECAVGAYAVHADLVNKYKTACGLPITQDGESSSSGSQDGGLATLSTEDRTSGSGSSALDTEVTSEPEVEESTPEPTTAQVKSNSTTVVHALTSSAPAPSSSLVMVAGSTILALAATHVL